jgi:hypothetical protein
LFYFDFIIPDEVPGFRDIVTVGFENGGAQKLLTYAGISGFQKQKAYGVQPLHTLWGVLGLSVSA